jgi:hypothetical protein
MVGGPNEGTTALGAAGTLTQEVNAMFIRDHVD